MVVAHSDQKIQEKLHHPQPNEEAMHIQHIESPHKAGKTLIGHSFLKGLISFPMCLFFKLCDRPFSHLAKVMPRKLENYLF